MAGWIIGIAVFVWQFVAMMVGVRQALDYKSTWRAFFVILISFIVVMIVIIPLAILWWIVAGGEVASS